MSKEVIVKKGDVCYHKSVPGKPLVVLKILDKHDANGKFQMIKCRFHGLDGMFHIYEFYPFELIK